MHERFIRACPLGFSNSPGSGQFKIFNSLYSTLWKVYSEYTLFQWGLSIGFLRTRVCVCTGFPGERSAVLFKNIQWTFLWGVVSHAWWVTTRLPGDIFEQNRRALPGDSIHACERNPMDTPHWKSVYSEYTFCSPGNLKNPMDKLLYLCSCMWYCVRQKILCKIEMEKLYFPRDLQLRGERGRSISRELWVYNRVVGYDQIYQAVTIQWTSPWRIHIHTLSCIIYTGAWPGTVRCLKASCPSCRVNIIRDLKLAWWAAGVAIKGVMHS